MDGEPSAERENADLTKGGHRLKGRVVPRHQPHGAQPGREQASAGVLEPLELLLLLPEPLDHPYTADRAVHDARDIGGLLLRVPARGKDLPAGGERDEPERWTDQEGHDRQHG